MDGLMDDGWMDKWTLDRLVDGWMYSWMVDRLMGGWMDNG